MAADAFGNDVTAVGVPVAGFLGYAPAGTTFPTPAGGVSTSLSLDPAFQKIGLIVEDGGFQWTEEPNGDPITFWQDGYSIPSGLANVQLVAKAAQYNEIVRKVTYGQTADANGYITIDGGGHADVYVLFTEEIFANGVIRRRVAPSCTVTGVKRDQSARGQANGTELTFTVARTSLLGNKHIGEWLIPAPAQAVANVTAATPTAAAAGTLVTITGTGFTAATGVKFGATAALLFIVDSDTQIRAVVPPGTAGAANVTVQNAAGNSNSLTYTRGA
jgi:hypothetical protein